MTTLTLDQARTIIYSAATADEALEALRLIGVEATSYEHEAYSVECGDLTFVSFTYSPHTKKLYVLEAGEFVTPEQRKAFLESQQQSSDSVSAVSTVAEARPDLDPHGNLLEAITCHSCDRDNFEPFFSDRGVRLVCHHCKASEWLGFGSVPPEFQ